MRATCLPVDYRKPPAGERCGDGFLKGFEAARSSRGPEVIASVEVVGAGEGVSLECCVSVRVAGEPVRTRILKNNCTPAFP